MRRLLALAAAVVLAPGPALPAWADTDVPDETGEPGEPGEGPNYPRGGEPPEGSETAFEFQDPLVSESSGIAPSLRHEGVWWTHNDSGLHEPRVYAVDEDGETLATLTLNVELRDWEAVTVAEGPDGKPQIHIGDIGDNFGGGWPDIRVYRFPEPETLADAAIDPTALTLAYEDGGRDAESMMIDPRDGRLYLASKEFSGGLYAAPEELDPEGENVLERIESAPLFATDAAFHPDGTRYVIRTYWGATVYDSTDGVPGDAIGSFDLPEMDQGESIAFTPDGTALMAGTEGEHAPVWRVPLADEFLSEEDAELAAGDGEETGASPEEAESGDGDDDSALGLIAGGAVVAGVLIAAVLWLARRS
ncbi:hypothetical protein [Nocardiopsis kunsanensis]|uniref:hypothetical protein n=1 Tax=Nocardiopsis kunsanensis TaxID=141693 RepID=UPI00034843A9|nr:hypothetical protein [Nocardiopsis kunsanensis]